MLPAAVHWVLYTTRQRELAMLVGAMQHGPSTDCGHVVAEQGLLSPPYVPPPPVQTLCELGRPTLIPEYTRQHAPRVGCGQDVAVQATPTPRNVPCVPVQIDPTSVRQ